MTSLMRRSRSTCDFAVPFRTLRPQLAIGDVSFDIARNPSIAGSSSWQNYRSHKQQKIEERDVAGSHIVCCCNDDQYH
jgi:hypothetical protein